MNGAFLMACACLLAVSLVHAGNEQPAAVQKNVAFLKQTNSPAPALKFTPGQTNQFFAWTNRVQPPRTALRVPQPAEDPAPVQLPPGVYETEPYTCIVVVPGPHPDERALVSPGQPKPRMPIVTPDLKFIPRPRAK